MNYKVLFSSCLLALTSSLYAQKSVFNFENQAPSEWKANKSSLSLDGEHLREGKSSLKWNPVNGASLDVALDKMTYWNSVIYVPVYNLKPSDAKLVFRFFADADKKQLVRSSEMLLNFKGWREFHKHIDLDFGKGLKRSGFVAMEIEYISTSGQNSPVWFDQVDLAAPYKDAYQRRVPGPFMKSDFEKGYFKNVGNLDASYINAYYRTPEDVTVTDQERKDYDKIKETFKIDLKFLRNGGVATSKAAPYLNRQKADAAIKYVESLNIRQNPDGTVVGKPLPLKTYTTPGDLVKLSYNIVALTYAADVMKDKKAEELLILYTRYLLDQGIAEGGRAFVPTNSYENARGFLLGFMYAMPFYEKYDAANPAMTLSQDVKDMLRWTYTFGQVYGSEKHDMTIDFIYLKSKYLFALADFHPTLDEKVKDVVAIKRFYENFLNIVPGAASVIKPDYTGFHHNAQHNSYMYGMSNWIADVYKLKGTAFQPSQEAYSNIANFVKTLYLQAATSKNEAYYGNALSGRGPFKLDVPVNYKSLEQLIEIGGAIKGQAFDPELAAVYNSLTKTTKYPVAPADLNGFTQLNYASMGVYRTDDWVANFRGLTSNLWGTEIYPTANRFGRYQSYGAIEILYRDPKNILTKSGYPVAEKAWDWNVVPGATTVHTDYENLNPVKPRADEIQIKDFAGSLAMGNSGIFALDFEEDSKNYWGGEETRYPTNDLKFKKSVFVNNDMIVALGSDISANPSFDQDIVATNLFQHILTKSNEPMYLNSNKSVADTLTASTDLSKKSFWMVAPSGTGFFMPKQNGELQVVRGTQVVPDHTIQANKKINKTYAQEAAKAWIKHSGKADRYEFVIKPNTNASEMAKYTKLLEKGSEYKVIKQDASAHIVSFPKDKKTGYVFFNAVSDLNTLLSGTTKPVLAMIQEAGNEVTVDVTSPDLNAQKNDEYRWLSMPLDVQLTFKGSWKLKDANGYKITVKDGNTIVECSLQDGLKKSFTLIK